MGERGAYGTTAKEYLSNHRTLLEGLSYINEDAPKLHPKIKKLITNTRGKVEDLEGLL